MVYTPKTSTVNDALPILKSVTIFSGINDRNLEYIYENCALLEAQVGDILVEEGMPATEIFILLRGNVTIVLNLREEPIELVDFGRGNCIGEASVIGIQNHSASAVVLDDALLLVLTRKILMCIFETNKDLFSFLILNIARELARRLHHSDEILLHYGKRDGNSKKSRIIKGTDPKRVQVNNGHS